MTDIEQKALALLNTVARERGGIEALPQEFSSINCWEAEALCRAIEQHEALQAENARLQSEIDRLRGPVLTYEKGYSVGDGDTALQETGQ